VSRIVDVDLGMPVDWVGWRTGAAAEAVEAVQGLEAADDVTAARVAAVRELDEILEDEGRVAGGIWVPDPADAPWGQLTVTLYVPGDEEVSTPQELLRQLSTPRRQAGSRVFDYSVALGECEAGPMVVQVEVRGEAESGAVQCSLAQTVFPAGGRELVRLVYTTERPAVFEALAQETLSVAAHLTVEREGVK